MPLPEVGRPVGCPLVFHVCCPPGRPVGCLFVFHVCCPPGRPVSKFQFNDFAQYIRERLLHLQNLCCNLCYLVDVLFLSPFSSSAMYQELTQVMEELLFLS